MHEFTQYLWSSILQQSYLQRARNLSEIQGTFDGPFVVIVVCTQRFDNLALRAR